MSIGHKLQRSNHPHEGLQPHTPHSHVAQGGGCDAVAAQRGFVPFNPGPPPPPSKTCGNSCCPSNRVCVCGSCFPPGGPFPACAAPGPGIIYSCCDDEGTQCNRCNRECCLGTDRCSCKGTCIAEGAREPVCDESDYGDFGNPLRNCCESPETGARCSGRGIHIFPVEDKPVLDGPHLADAAGP